MKYLLPLLFLIAACSFGPAPDPNPTQEVTTLATNLNVPWDIVKLPNNNYLITERQGNVLLLNQDLQTIKTLEVRNRGEGGLLGITLHPNFQTNRFVYLYSTQQTDQGTINRVDRYTYNNSLTFNKTIIDNIPGASYHDGGRIIFGPDNLLYIATGDAGNDQLAQDTSSLAGKILRITDEGEIPNDNPFNNEVFSYGHRNPQGLAFHNNQLYGTEHGRSGIQSGFDEINIIQAGNNYGWPIIQGDETQEGMQTPLLHSGPSTTWAPASATIHNNVLYFGGLRGGAVYAYDLQTQSLTKVLEGYGRIRTVITDNNSLLITTSNTDGRGQPADTDDKLLRFLV